MCARRFSRSTQRIPSSLWRRRTVTPSFRAASISCDRRMVRWGTEALVATNVAGPPSGPDIAPTHVLIRGNYRQPGEAVEPGFPSAITGEAEPAVLETDRYRQFPTRGRRMTLAKWIAESGESADSARDGESHLAASFRPGHRPNAERLRQERRPADCIRSCWTGWRCASSSRAGTSRRCTG